MATVVSFTDYTPPARFDSVPWTQARIQEATARDGTYATIDTVSLGTVNPDPSKPASRDFTTALGTAVNLWYRVIFLDGSSGTSDPTVPLQNISPDSSTYITMSQMKETLEIEGETYADDDIVVSIESASRVIDAYKGTRFFPTAETRTYTPPGCIPTAWNPNDQSLPIYDLCGLDHVTVDLTGDGSFGSTWVQGTDFYLEPFDADLTGKPWNTITLRWQAGRQWPSWQYSVRVAGTFGWETAPGQVVEACGILANRYLKRIRETPYGIVAIGTDAMAMARLGKIDPDVAFMLDNISDEDVPLLIL